MTSDIEVALSDDDEWHRLDILGCNYAAVIPAPKDRRTVSHDELSELPHDRCEKCTW